VNVAPNRIAQFNGAIEIYYGPTVTKIWEFFLQKINYSSANMRARTKKTHQIRGICVRAMEQSQEIYNRLTLDATASKI